MSINALLDCVVNDVLQLGRSGTGFSFFIVLRLASDVTIIEGIFLQEIRIQTALIVAVSVAVVICVVVVSIARMGFLFELAVENIEFVEIAIVAAV